jgi:hypothetical protein
LVGIECRRAFLWGCRVHGGVFGFAFIEGNVDCCWGPDVDEGSEGVEGMIVEWDEKLVDVDSIVGSVVVHGSMISGDLLGNR